MNVEKAIDILRKTHPWITSIEKSGKKYIVRYGWFEGTVEELTARELIKKARTSTSDNRQTTSLKKRLKQNSNRTNRVLVRDAIKTESFDDIPSNGNMFEDDYENYT